jgi:polysaccharide export outer membrane protein
MSIVLRVVVVVAVAMTASKSLVMALPGEHRAAQAAKSLSQDNSASETKTADEEQYFKDVYRRFYESYKFGPGDQIAVRVLGNPDYTMEKVEVSPVGSIYHPLLGEVQVVGLTKTRLEEKLTVDLSEYILTPRVSISLLDARSAKIGVLGEVINPGVIVMARPMTVLDAIAAAGGFTDFGDRSAVELHRHRGDGTYSRMKVNLKSILEDKASPEENILLKAGDAVMVHGNKKKALNRIVGYVGFANFLTFLSLGR